MASYIHAYMKLLIKHALEPVTDMTHTAVFHFKQDSFTSLILCCILAYVTIFIIKTDARPSSIYPSQYLVINIAIPHPIMLCYLYRSILWTPSLLQDSAWRLALHPVRPQALHQRLETIQVVFTVISLVIS